MHTIHLTDILMRLFAMIGILTVGISGIATLINAGSKLLKHRRSEKRYHDEERADLEEKITRLHRSIIGKINGE